MAQFALDRSDPQPEQALDHLRRVQNTTPREAAIVRFCEGKANRLRKRFDLAEKQWIEALQIDATVPEAGWALLDLLDLEGRNEEAHRLGMWIHGVEPNPRERVRALLELSRIDVDRVAPEFLVPMIQPVYLQHRESLSLALVTGRALIRNSQFDEGLEALRDALRRHPDSARVWDAWLTGLVEASRPEEFVQEFARLPRSLAADPRFAKHEGNVAQVRRDWPTAVQAYRRAHELEPFDRGILNRLRTVLRVAGQNAEADRMDQKFIAYQAAFKQMREVYTEALAVATLGLAPHPDLYHRLADLRETLGRFDEALAWHRLVLRDAPDDAVSLAALERLKYHQQAAGKQPTPSLSDIFRD